MEGLVREMQDPENGVPVRSQKLFLTSIPAAFMGKYPGRFICFSATPSLRRPCYGSPQDREQIGPHNFMVLITRTSLAGENARVSSSARSNALACRLIKPKIQCLARERTRALACVFVPTWKPIFVHLKKCST